MSYQKDPWVYIDDIGEVNTDDGEIRDVVIGNDLALKLARKVDFHNRQQKAHEAAMRAAKRALAKYALSDTKSVITDGLRSRWVNGHSQEKQDKGAMRLHLESMELTRDDLVALVLAADGFDMGRLPESLCEALAPYVSYSDTEGYVVVEDAPQLAPKRRGPSPAAKDIDEWERSIDQINQKRQMEAVK